MKQARAKTYTTAYSGQPDSGEFIEISKNFNWLRMPLHFELNHINLWLIEGADGWAAVDSGFNTPESVNTWDKILINNFKNKELKSVFITHFHPDHFGLAGWLHGRTGVIPYMAAGEFAMVDHLTNPASAEHLKSIYQLYFKESGVNFNLLDELVKKRMLYRQIISPPPVEVQTVKDGDIVGLSDMEWEVVVGNGHCPEHACLYNAKDKFFISGDIVLPDISPNISFFPGNAPDHDPVADYLATLDRVREKIPDDVTVFPSHGVPFKGLHQRIVELKQHHERRFTKMHEVLEGRSLSAFEVMSGLFAHRGDLKGSDLFFGLGETLAHLVYEVRRGRISVRPSAEGVNIYTRG